VRPIKDEPATALSDKPLDTPPDIGGTGEVYIEVGVVVVVVVGVVGEGTVRSN